MRVKIVCEFTLILCEFALSSLLHLTCIRHAFILVILMFSKSNRIEESQSNRNEKGTSEGSGELELDHEQGLFIQAVLRGELVFLSG